MLFKKKKESKSRALESPTRESHSFLVVREQKGNSDITEMTKLNNLDYVCALELTHL